MSLEAKLAFSRRDWNVCFFISRVFSRSPPTSLWAFLIVRPLILTFWVFSWSTPASFEVFWVQLNLQFHISSWRSNRMNSWPAAASFHLFRATFIGRLRIRDCFNDRMNTWSASTSLHLYRSTPFFGRQGIDPGSSTTSLDRLLTALVLRLDPRSDSTYLDSLVNVPVPNGQTSIRQRNNNRVYPRSSLEENIEDWLLIFFSLFTGVRD